MITDSLENLNLYKGTIPYAEIISDFISNNDMSKLDTGRHDITDKVYVNILEYEPKIPEKYEAHREYADLQIIISGKEKMKSALLPDNLPEQDYNSEGDYILFEKCETGFAEFEAVCGMLYYYAPQDAHMPGIKFQEGKIKKAVFKIKL